MCNSFPEFGLVSMGEILKETLEFLKKNIPDILPLSLKILHPLTLPPHSYNPRRKQYLSPAFLHWIKENYPGESVLGITDKDLYVPGLNFVFGQAELRGRVGVVSLARLRGKDDQREEISLTRILKESVHELGHILGLRHCPNTLCVMSFSNSLYDVDRKREILCGRCSHLLGLG